MINKKAKHSFAFLFTPCLAISDISANILATYDYDAYGQVTLTSGTPAFQNAFLFTGREFERETGLYYYRARYYDTKTGKFIQRDPIDISDGVNLYVYVGNNGVNFVDPSGMEKKWIKENEGNAWYIYTTDFSDLDTGHSMLYYIYNCEEKVISFQPLNFDNGFFFNNESIFDTGKSEILRAKSYINTGLSTLITKENINISGVDNWFSNKLSNKPDYNTFTNNCTTEVKKALLSGGIFLVSTDTPWGLKIALDIYL